MDEKAEVFRLEIDENKRQILVFRGVSQGDFQRVLDGMRDWRENSDDRIFCIRLNSNQFVELIRIE